MGGASETATPRIPEDQEVTESYLNSSARRRSSLTGKPPLPRAREEEEEAEEELVFVLEEFIDERNPGVGRQVQQ